jgi:tRNA(fMet)-specific endonuclease VapC
VTISKTLVDTDILSAIMKRRPVALNHARNYLATHPQLTLSLITRYEVRRGLEAKNAAKQLVAFDRFCAANEVLPLTESIVVRASESYGDLHSRGCLIGDADILSAATAIEHGAVVSTNNEAHFRRVPNLVVVNWLSP